VILRRSTEVMDVDRLDPADFPHRRLARDALGRRALWRAQPDNARAAVLPPRLVREGGSGAAGRRPKMLLAAARHFHDPSAGRYGVAWNAARGTALAIPS
jgi:multiple sugar transport system substrate-binding protein